MVLARSNSSICSGKTLQRAQWCLGSLVIIRTTDETKLQRTANGENTDSVSTLCHTLHSFIDSGLCPLCNRFDDDSARSAEFEKPSIAGDNFAAVFICLGRTLGHVINLDTKVITLSF